MTLTFNASGGWVLPPSEAKHRSFSEDFWHENGNYFCICLHCGNEFVGHKRRMVCKLCSTAEKAG